MTLTMTTQQQHRPTNVIVRTENSSSSSSIDSYNTNTSASASGSASSLSLFRFPHFHHRRRRHHHDPVEYYDYCYHPTTFNKSTFITTTTTTTTNDNDANTNVIIKLHPQQERINPPKIIWLMSFPNSGTTYTLKFVQGATMTSTATNYGSNEQEGYNTSISIDERFIYGPYLRYPDRPYPCNSILTKTHCHQDEVLSTNVSHFIDSCRIGNRNINNTRQESIPYHISTHVYSAIHLIRNPFDNIVARMHYKQKQWLHSNTSKDQELIQYITMTPIGLSRWCHYIQLMEQKHYINTIDTIFWDMYMKDLPCAIEFYKYLHWHHYATEGIRTLLNNRALVVYYEDYTTQFNQTTQHILQFLQFPSSLSSSSIPEFIVGKTYVDWFSSDIKEKVKRLALAMVSNDTWKLLQHYFE